MVKAICSSHYYGDDLQNAFCGKFSSSPSYIRVNVILAPIPVAEATYDNKVMMTLFYDSIL